MTPEQYLKESHVVSIPSGWLGLILCYGTPTDRMECNPHRQPRFYGIAFRNIWIGVVIAWRKP